MQESDLKHDSNSRRQRGSKKTTNKLSSLLEILPSEIQCKDDMKSVVTFSADDKEAENFKQLAKQVSSREIELDIGALAIDDMEEEKFLSDDEKYLSNYCADAGKGIGNNLTLFLESSLHKPKCLDDVKTVVTFSADDKEQRNFKQLAAELSNIETGLDIATLAVKRAEEETFNFSYHDEEEEIKEKYSPTQRKVKKNVKSSLNKFLKSPPTATFSLGDDNKSVVTFSSINKETDKFMELASRHSTAKNLHLSDVLVGNETKKRPIMKKAQSDRHMFDVNKGREKMKMSSLMEPRSSEKLSDGTVRTEKKTRPSLKKALSDRAMLSGGKERMKSSSSKHSQS